METLFSGGKLFDGKRETVAGMGVLVKDGHVEVIAPVATFDGFSGVRIDTTEQTLLPGLVDCHVHLALGAEFDIGSALAKLKPAHLTMAMLQRAQRTLAGGVTAIRDCGGKDYHEFAIRDACNSGQQLGPTIRAVGRMICMTGGHGSRMGRIADGTDDVVRAVREQIHFGADFVKLMATGGVMTPGVDPMDAHYSEAEMAAGVGEAQRFRKPTACHAMATAGILNSARAGATSIEHGTFMDEACLEEMLKRDIFLVPTMSPPRSMSPHKQRFPLALQDRLEMMDRATADTVKMFYQAGGKIAMGTDSGVPFTKHGENALELLYMVEAGMTPIDALRSATTLGAELLQLEHEGEIKSGSSADFLLVDGDPTADIEMVARSENHRGVWKRGLEVASSFGSRTATELGSSSY